MAGLIEKAIAYRTPLGTLFEVTPEGGGDPMWQRPSQYQILTTTDGKPVMRMTLVADHAPSERRQTATIDLSLDKLGTMMLGPIEPLQVIEAKPAKPQAVPDPPDEKKDEGK